MNGIIRGRPSSEVRHVESRGERAKAKCRVLEAKAYAAKAEEAEERATAVSAVGSDGDERRMLEQAKAYPAKGVSNDVKVPYWCRRANAKAEASDSGVHHVLVPNWQPAHNL